MKVFEIAKKDNIKNIQIFTDESCNYGLYQKLGCSKVYEKIIPNGEPDKLGNITCEKGFIFKKTLIKKLFYNLSLLSNQLNYAIISM